jgi:hypothetical protein
VSIHRFSFLTTTGDERNALYPACALIVEPEDAASAFHCGGVTRPEAEDAASAFMVIVGAPAKCASSFYLNRRKKVCYIVSISYYCTLNRERFEFASIRIYGCEMESHPGNGLVNSAGAFPGTTTAGLLYSMTNISS